MNLPLTTTSSTNAHAVSVYVGLFLLGAFYVLGPTQSALFELYGGYTARVAMGLLSLFSLVALGGAIAAQKSSDPSEGLRIEALTLTPVVGLLAALLGSFVYVYGLQGAPTTIGFTMIFLAGCGGRCVQAFRDRHRVEFARRVNTGLKAEVAALPDEVE